MESIHDIHHAHNYFMSPFQIVSFEGALPLRFGMTPSEVISILGDPRSVSTRRQTPLCHTYDLPNAQLNVGFGGEGQTADHFGFGRGSHVVFDSIDFFCDRFVRRSLLEMSDEYYECLGFLVFCDLGIALSGFHDGDEDDLAVRVFPRGAWEKFRPRFKSFVPL